MRRAVVAGLVVGLSLGGLLPDPLPRLVAAADTDVVINELHYNPEDDNPASEYIELFNRGGAAVNLSGWFFNGITFTFPPGSSIAPGGFVVLYSGQYTGALSNGGERIRLRNAGSTIIDEVTYDDAGLWPALADGDGHSLQRRDPFGPSGDPGNWVSAPPTPGAPNSGMGGLMPVFSDVSHTVLPAAGAPIAVSAKLAHATGANLAFRVGFGPEAVIAMTVAAGTATASIPGQAAGALVRYRLVATSPGGVVGTWPRQGDGSVYTGTTVATPTTSKLPRFEWFMDDATYLKAYFDLTLTGDDGYPMVFAYGGKIFDNAKIRVKGQVSRTFPKKKWKVILPPGYALDAPELFPEPVDEFALHSAWSDKSFLRETLASEFMVRAGVPASQAFPVRLERNGAFYGLYTYHEQPDGTWRERHGLDDSIVYEAGPDFIFGSLTASDANLSQTNLRKKYDKETFEYLDDSELRDLIRQLNSLTGNARRAWIYENVDVAEVVNTIAASVVIQHQDIGHKNYRLVYDEQGRWGTIPSDFDLSYGRRWSNVYGALESTVYVGGAFEHPGGPLFGAFWFDPELSEMVRRRIRTLTETQLEPIAVSLRVQELRDLVAEEAALDRQVWGTYGPSQSPSVAAGQIIGNYVAPQYLRILTTLANAGRVARPSQPAVPAVSFEAVRYPTPDNPIQFVILRNNSGNSVDLSGFTIDAIDLVIPGGTVVLPGRTVVFVDPDFGVAKGVFPGRLFGGVYDGSLDGLDEGLRLRNPAGDLVALHNHLPPGSMTEISGLANRSAVVSIAIAQPFGPGFVQVLPCDATPGATSNLNSDGTGATVASLAIVQFDGSGKACIYTQPPTHLVVDLQGYLAVGAFDDVTDERILDTRSGERPAAGSQTQISGLANRSAVVSIAATQSAGTGFVQVLACGATPGTTSNVNARPGATVASLAIVQFDADGKACLYNQPSTHLVVDLQGYLAVDAFDDVPDDRILDTRSGDRPAAGSMTEINGTPNTSAVVSLAATQSAAAGFVQVLPCAGSPGATSNVNSRPGVTAASLAIVQFDGDGKACVFNQRATHLVVDLQGYFEPGAFDDVPDERLLDTRNR